MNAKPSPSNRARRGPGAPGPRKAAATVPADAESAPRVATIRDARRGDLEAVIALDAQDTGVEKRDYFRSLFRRTYDNVPAVDGVSFEVASGDRVGFLGPNGCCRSRPPG